MTDYLKSYTGTDSASVEWLRYKKEHEVLRERLELLAVMLVAFFVISGFFFTVWAVEPAEFRPYNCKDRGGIRQALTNRNGYATSYICEDGTQQPTQIQVRDMHWKWND